MHPTDDEPPAVMFAWELGGGLGHIAKGLMLAGPLAARGMEVSFGVRDLATSHPLLPDASHRLYQAPVCWARPHGDTPPPASHAELLLHAGFGDRAGLRGMVRGWLTIFEADRTRLVLADHAPAAVLAARCAGLPTVLFGHGFFAPPPGWPVFRTWEPVPAGRTDDARRQVLGGVNDCLRAFGAAELQQLSALYATAGNFLCTLPELDHYPGRPVGVRPSGPSADLSAGQRDAPLEGRPTDTYIGTLWVDDVGAPPDWPVAAGAVAPRVFAYLRPGLPGLEQVLAALQRSGASVLVTSPGLAPDVAARWQGPRLRFSRGLVALGGVARDADLVICSGSDTLHGLAQAGVPVLGLPLNAEQRIAGERIAQTGAGRWLLPGSCDTDALLATIRDLLGAPRYREAARRLAQRSSRLSREAQLAPVVAACAALVGSDRGGGGDGGAADLPAAFTAPALAPGP